MGTMTDKANTGSRWLDVTGWAVWLMIIVVFLVWRLPHLGGFSWNYDEGLYMMTARLLARGHRLYTDVYYANPPLFASTLTLVFRWFGTSAFVARMTVVLWGVVSLLVVGLVARQVGGWPAALVATLALSLTPDFFFTSMASLSDGPAIALAAVATLSALIYRRRGEWRWMVLSGLTLSLSLLFKLLTVYAVPLVGTVALSRHIPRLFCIEDTSPPSTLPRAMLVLALAFLFPILLCFLLYGPHMYQQAIGQPWGSRNVYPLDLSGSLGEVWNYVQKNRALTVLSAWGAVVTLSTRFRRGWPVALWFVLALAFALYHTPLQTHHLAALLLPMAVLAGGAVADTGERLRGLRGATHLPSASHLGGLIGLAAVLFFAAEVPRMATTTRHWIAWGQGDVEWEAVEYLQQVTVPDDLVISDDQMLAFRAGRDVPPWLGDTSLVRIRSGYLTMADLQAQTERYRPAAVVSWSGRFAWLPGYLEWLDTQYVARRSFGGDRTVYFGQRLLSLPPTAYPLHAGLGGQVRLVGYTPHGQAQSRPLPPAARRPLYATLYWQALTPMDADYTVFVHLLDGDGRLRVQGDGQPFQGLWPTSAWRPGEVMADRYAVPIGADVPPGEYRLVIGMYLLDTLERLPVTDESGAPLGDAVSLGTVEVPTGP